MHRARGPGAELLRAAIRHRAEPAAAGASTAAAGGTGPILSRVPEDAKPRTAPVPIQARPVALRVPTEAGILGRELKQNGSVGVPKIDRPAGGDLSARMTLVGRRGQTADSCTVQINGKLSVQSKADGPSGIASRIRAAR